MQLKQGCLNEACGLQAKRIQSLRKVSEANEVQGVNVCPFTERKIRNPSEWDIPLTVPSLQWRDNVLLRAEIGCLHLEGLWPPYYSWTHET